VGKEGTGRVLIPGGEKKEKEATLYYASRFVPSGRKGRKRRVPVGHGRRAPMT